MGNANYSGWGLGVYALLVAGFVVLATAMVLTLLEKPPEGMYARAHQSVKVKR